MEVCLKSFFKFNLIFLLLFFSTCSYPNGPEYGKCVDSKSRHFLCFGIEDFRQTFYLNEPLTFKSEELFQFKADYRKGVLSARKAGEILISKSDSLLSTRPPSVVLRGELNINHEPNDYVSIGTYWWPDPNSPDGLPYIRRDGFRNPEVDLYDRNELSRFVEGLNTLTISYYLTHNSSYYTKALEFLHSWFINPETRMNPNLNYAQAIPGISSGRATGIIEGRGFINVLDAIAILKSDEDWDLNYEYNIFRWYKQYFDWLRNDHNSSEMKKFTNNHASWYNLQLVSYSLVLGDSITAIRLLKNIPHSVVDVQINDNGKQPKEINRGNGLNYSVFNLRALTVLADLGRKKNIDLWNYPQAENSKIFSAFSFLQPFVMKTESWPFDQNAGFSGCSFIPILQSVFNEKEDNVYRKDIKALSSLYSCDPYSFLN